MIAGTADDPRKKTKALFWPLTFGSTAILRIPPIKTPRSAEKSKARQLFDFVL